MGNFAENLNLGNRFRPPLGIRNCQKTKAKQNKKTKQNKTKQKQNNTHKKKQSKTKNKQTNKKTNKSFVWKICT